MEQQAGLSFPEVELTTVEVAGITADNYKAVRNVETEQIYDIVSPKYKLVRHEKVLKNVEEVLEKNPDFGSYSKHVFLYKDGARMRTKYRFDDAQVVVKFRGKDDIMNPTLEVFNSYDRSCKHTVMLGAFRLVCTNGLVVGETFAKYRKRHMPDLYLEDVQHALKGGFTALDTQRQQWQDWTSTPLLPEKFEKVEKKLDLNNKETTLLLEEPEMGTNANLARWLALHEMGGKWEKEAEEYMNMWIFYNILTQFTTHHIASEVRRQQLEDRIRVSVFN
jgi:hypothetical protein